MTLIQILILALVQGLAEMLPVSSSAHVILAQKLMGLDPSAPQMTFLLVMLHTGTMFAALLYFGKRWLQLMIPPKSAGSLITASNQNPSWGRFHFLKMILLATACTGVVGLGLKVIIEKMILEHLMHYPKGEVQALFKNLPMVGGALFVAGLLILWSSRREAAAKDTKLSPRQAIAIGLIQGLCLPFRGLSRSGATISVGMNEGVSRRLAEEFSFALAIVLTPPVILIELRRLLKHHLEAGAAEASFSMSSAFAPGLVGMVFSFIGGLIALRWLSSWLEQGKWNFFGYYCLIFACVVFAASFAGF